MNMFAPWWWGQWRNGYWGNGDSLIIWLFSGIFGGLISACYALRESEQIVISVGASGAIMGIAGAAIATQLASGAGHTIKPAASISSVGYGGADTVVWYPANRNR